jgi:hypothetical protein
MKVGIPHLSCAVRYRYYAAPDGVYTSTSASGKVVAFEYEIAQKSKNWLKTKFTSMFHALEVKHR